MEGMYVIYSAMVIFGLFGLFGLIYKISKDGERDLLDKMLSHGDISGYVYGKYIKRL
jgi:hypothetical protein